MPKHHGKSPYTGKAIREKVSGHKSIGLEEDIHEYASRLEARCAKLLIKHGIPFRPHVKFKCVDRELKEFTYEVDFLFNEPRKFRGIEAVDGIEVKGVLSSHDFLRKNALKYWHDLDIYIVLKDLIDFWEREGMRKEPTKSESNGKTDK